MIAQYKSAIWSPSPKFSKRKEKITTIVIHITDGQPDISKAVKRMQTTTKDVSAHFMIGRAGEIVQLVKIEDVAWHARGANGKSIGIEHCARSPGELSKKDPGLPVTEEQYKVSSELVAWLCKNYDIPIDREHIQGHCELKDEDGSFLSTHRDCPNRIWDWDKYMKYVLDNAKIL